jgi:hypothetical protein
MNDIAPILTPDRSRELLQALGEQLAARKASYELVVIGGSALQARGLVDRPTRDVDVVARIDAGRLVTAEPLPAPLVEARDRVARDFSLPERWLNADPSDLLRLGLPDGFMERAVTHAYGPALVVHFASRADQVHFKFYATVDQGPGRHEADLRVLEPTSDELVSAARWTRQHDPSPAHLELLRAALAAFGVEDADLGA